ncbi:ferric reductase-like transmembrane component [Cladorrhinum samala]|uniref:Ferric reductase-like transmembrane component n=1 Tax=Cladorrhinum samala TaxID=585594 RepID=A0AAV9HKD3_9PEZI|nr:ferric reductase-like transmembrane component [Cladorrhinum samala]
MKVPSAAVAVRWVVGLVGLSACPASGQLLAGYGFYPYEPLCAESCYRALSSYMLDCTPTAAGHDHDHGHGAATPPECYAANTPFLTTVAWCFHTKCEQNGVPVSKIQWFWERSVTGSPSVQAKWTYSTALDHVDPRPPASQLNDSHTYLNDTSIVSPVAYLKQWNVLGMVARENRVESKFSIIILATALGIPIVLTCLFYMPFLDTIVDRTKPYLVYPSLIGRYHVRPLPFRLGNAPTVGQGLYIFIFLLLSIVLAAADYKSGQPNAWFASRSKEVSAYVLYRTGTLGFMLLPIVFLFSSRNNVLLWLTNWSHSTYLLLHRWVARVFMLYAVVHSIIGLQNYAHYSKTPWWIWGAVATVAAVILTVGSGLYVRASHYELFLISHILLSVFLVIGCWYHLTGWYTSMGITLATTWGYEVWLYFAIAVWFSDRLLRLGRVLRHGAPRAKVTDLGQGYFRVDVRGVRWAATPGRHVYVYFPTLSLARPWENHPFSVIPTPTLPVRPLGLPARKDDEEKQQCAAELAQVASDRDHGGPAAAAGFTLFIKQSGGMTKHLRAHDGLLTLLDGPYSNSHTGDVLRCDRVLLIAGGIGITGVLAWASRHWNVKLAWSVSDSARGLTEAIDLSGIANREVRVGTRFEVDELINEEVAAGWERVGVVVCGPGGLCDDVRAAVVAAGRRAQGKTCFELEVDAYSW